MTQKAKSLYKVVPKHICTYTHIQVQEIAIHTYTHTLQYIIIYIQTHGQMQTNNHKTTTKGNYNRKKTNLNTKKKMLKFMFKSRQDKTSNGIEFHNIGEATKKEYQNALMVEDSRFKVKECDLVANVLKWKYLEKSMAVVLCKIQ